MLNPFKLASTLLSNTADAKGKRGELQSSITLKLGLNKNTYDIYNDVTVYIDNNKTKNDTTQIDHVIISPFGIFVLEVKNFSGFIFGSEQQYKWTQTLNRNTKNQFLNPLIQNKKHITALQAIFNVAEENFYSMVVFMNKVTFKTDMPDNVMLLQDMVSYIKRHQNVCLSDSKIKQCKIRLENRKIAKGTIADTVHMAKIAEKREQATASNSTAPSKLATPKEEKITTKASTVNNCEDEAIPTKTCPKCGSDMVKRIAKKGKNAGNEFYGCSSFPKCRFIENSNP